MTAVLFKFSNPDGTPVANAPFRLTTRKPSFDETLHNGIQLPGDVNATTDAQGEATVTLMAGFASYYLLMDRPGATPDSDGCTAGLRYRFMVTESNTPLRVEDLIVTTPTWSRPWDETALQIIIDAKALSQAAAIAAAASELAAAVSADNSAESAAASEVSAQNSETSHQGAVVSAGAALTSENAAKTSELASKGSQDAARASELAAAASADFAAGAVQDMQDQVDEATLQAGLSATSAGQSATSAGASATSAAEAEADRQLTAADVVTTTDNKNLTAADVVTITNLKTDVIGLKDETKVYRDEALAALGSITGVISDGGPIDLSAGVYPSEPTISTVWRVTGAGTVSGVVYNVGDQLFYTKDQDLFYKLDGTENVHSVAGKIGDVLLDKADVGLPLVDNTPDTDKPVSTAQQAALGAKVNIADIVDTLVSTDPAKPLSAKQGKVLYDLVQANNVTLSVFEYLATAGQTVFTGLDINGLPLLYTPGTGTIVLRNGVTLERTVDYTATSGNSVTAGQACDLNDLIQIMAFGAFAVANHYTKAEDDALFANRYTKPESDALFADSYITSVISAGVLTVNASLANHQGVALTSNVTSLVLSGAVNGTVKKVKVLFTQPSGGKTIAIPSNVRLDNRYSKLASLEAGSMTVVEFMTVDGGVNWMASINSIASAATPVTFTLPPLAVNNEVFNDEGTATTGWTSDGVTLSTSGSYTRVTKNGAPGTGGGIVRAVSMPASGKDWIIYAKMRTSSTNMIAMWVEDAAGVKVNTVWFNGDGGGNLNPGYIGLSGQTGSTVNAVTAATGIDTTVALDLAFQYDGKFGTLSLFFRTSDGTWQFRGRVATDNIIPTKLAIRHSGGSAANAWFEWDFISICRPNVVVIGDSIAEGKNLYSPNLSLALYDFTSHWARYAKLYPALRNNLPVIKGVGAETSTAALARFNTDISHGQYFVFVHASSNDHYQGISKLTRTNNYKAMNTAALAVGAKMVLFNALYATETYNAAYPGHRDYCQTWWAEDAYSVPVEARVDIMLPVLSGNGFLNAAVAQSDGIHPTPAGYQLIGQYIAP